MQKKRRSVPISSSDLEQAEFLEDDEEDSSNLEEELVIVEKMQRSFPDNYISIDKTSDINGSTALLENASNWKKKMALAMTSSSTTTTTTANVEDADDRQGHIAQQTKTIISANDSDKINKLVDRGGDFWGVGVEKGGRGGKNDKSGAKTAVISLHYPYYPFGSSGNTITSSANSNTSRVNENGNEKLNNGMDYKKSDDQGYKNRPTSGFGGEVDSGINRNGDLCNGMLDEEKKEKCEQKQLFYCKQVGWDPVLKKFHIQMDTMINKPVEKENSKEQGAITAAVGDKGPMPVKSPVTPLSPAPAQNSEGKVARPSSASPKQTVTENCHGDHREENKRVEQPLNKEIEKQVGRETASPSIDILGDLGINASHITFREGGTKREVEEESIAILPDVPMLDGMEENEKNGGVIVRRGGDQEEKEGEEEEGDEENRLVIDMAGEQDERRREDDEKDKERMKPPRELRSPKEKEGGGEEDFQCSQCQQVFTCDEDLQTHFSEEHVRLAHSAIILEPESPFPVVTVRGTSSIFEDEVEESEPFGGEGEGGKEVEGVIEAQLRVQVQAQVQAQQQRAQSQAMFHSNTLSSILAGRVGGDGGGGGSRMGETAERLLVEPLITSYMHEIQGARPTGVQVPQAPQQQQIQRPPSFPVRGQIGRPPLQQMLPQDYLLRQGQGQMRGPPPQGHRPQGQPGAPSHSRMPLNYRPGYPTALHQALLSQQQSQHNISTSHQTQYPPPRPQLRPIASTSSSAPTTTPSQMRPTGGGPGVTVHHPNQLPTRPPLTRGPSTHHPQNQSILRGSSPPSSGAPMQRISPPTNPSQPQGASELLVLQLQQRIQQVQDQIQKLNQQARQETNPSVQQRIRQDTTVLIEHFDQLNLQFKNLHLQLSSQNQRYQQQQQFQNQQNQNRQHQHHQQQLQNHNQQQRLQQLQHQQQQHQLQHQRALQQQAQAAAAQANKRPSIEIFDNGPSQKQPRLENDDVSLRLPNGVTLSVLPPHNSSSSSTGTSSPPHPQLVHPGMHSGGSTGSRHSSTNSGTTSPAGPSGPPLVSPGSMVSRLASSGITLTPANSSASHSPSPQTPPSSLNHPILSPISDCGGSPRGSPRIPGPPTTQVSTVIQRTPSSAASPVASSDNFAIPKAPQGPGGGGPSKTNAERPERPPTIDLTSDELQNHTLQMRQTGGGVVSREQILQHHLATLQRSLPDNSPRPPISTTTTTQFPMVSPPPPGGPSSATRKLFPCPFPQCHGQFGSPELLNEHRLRIHPNPPSFMSAPRPSPQVAIRRSTPPSPASPSSILAHRLDNLPPPQRAGVLIPRPSSAQILQQHMSRHPLPRPSDHQIYTTSRRPSLPSDHLDGEKYVVPLLNLEHLDDRKLRALNDFGVMSIIPLQGITKLGIPIMRLQPGVPLGHFPHDTAIEIGPVRRLSVEAGPRQGATDNPQISPRALPAPQSQPSPSSPSGTPPAQVTRTHPGGIPPHLQQQHQHPLQRPSGGHPQLCTDRSCPDNLRRPSPSTGGAGHAPPQAPQGRIVGSPTNPAMHNHPHYNHQGQGQGQQQQQQVQSPQNHHESFLGSHGQLIVTPVNRR